MNFRNKIVSILLPLFFLAICASHAFAFECEDLKKDIALDFKNQPNGPTDSRLFEYFNGSPHRRYYWSELWKGASIAGITVKNLRVKKKIGELIFNYLPIEGGGTTSHSIQVKQGDYTMLEFNFPYAVRSGISQQISFGSNTPDHIFYDGLVLHLDLRPMFPQFNCQY